SSVCSPSPQPSPLGRGGTAARLSNSRCASSWSWSGQDGSLSPRERVGVRGKKPLETCSHADCRDAPPTLHYANTPSFRPFLLRVPLPLFLKRISHLLFVFLQAQRDLCVIRHGRVRISHFGEIRQARLGQQELQHSVIAVQFLEFRNAAVLVFDIAENNGAR